MRRRQPLPRLWLMTDERMGDRLFDAIARLPHGSGIVVRHYGLPLAERRRLFRTIQRRAAPHRHLVLRAGKQRLGRHEDGSHQDPRGRAGGGAALRSMAVHNMAELALARRLRVDMILISPVFATQSHGGVSAMPRTRLRALLRHQFCPVMALGGMNARRAATLARMGVDGWAAIDAWLSRARPKRG